MHLAGRFEEAKLRPVPEHEGHCQGYSRFVMVDGAAGSKHMATAICQLEAGGRFDGHAHAFGEAFFLLEGRVTVTTRDGAHELGPAGFAFVPPEAEHGWQNEGAHPARWLQMVSLGEARTGATSGESIASFGHFDAGELPLGFGDAGSSESRHRQGLSISKLVDERLGAHEFAMFVPLLSPGGRVDLHEHPIEEFYYTISGEFELVLDGESRLMKPGDFGWSSVGCVHGFFSTGRVPARWIEMQAPGPPATDWIRFKE